MRTLLAVVVVALGVSACGSSPVTPSGENMSGTWQGYSAARNSNLTVTLAQTGSTLSGKWVDNTTHGGTITGTKLDVNVNITLVGNATTCNLSFTGTLSSLTSLTGTLVGQNCVSNVGGGMTFTKS